MNIAILGVRGIPSRYGGFETSAEQTAVRMVKLGHQVTVYCRNSKKQNKLAEYEGVRLVYIPTIHLKSLETIVHSIISGFHVAFINNVDVVHMYNSASSFGGLLVRVSGKKLVMTLDGVEWDRDNWGWVAKKVWRISTWLAVKISNNIICDSKVVSNYFMSLYGANIDYIPYGAKTLDVSMELDKSLGLQKKQYFIFVGRFVKEKGVDTLIDSYNKVGTDIPLVLVGDNENDPDYVDKLKSAAGSNVKFLGYRYGEEYEQLLVNSRAYISASVLEGTSPSLLAAMGARVCCLVNGIKENKETGADSVIFFDGTIDHLVEKIKILVQDDEVVDEYARKGRERVKKNYDWDAVTNRYLTNYERN